MSKEIFHHQKSGILGFIGMFVIAVIFIYVIPTFIVTLLVSSRQPLSAPGFTWFDVDLGFELWQINSLSFFGLEAGLLFMILSIIVLVPIFVIIPAKSRVIFETDQTYLIKRKSKGMLKITKRYKITDIDFLSSKSLTTIQASGGNDIGISIGMSTTHTLSIVMKGKSFKEKRLLSDKNPTLIQKLAESLQDSLGVKIKSTDRSSF